MLNRLSAVTGMLLFFSAARIVFPALGGLSDNLALLTMAYDKLKQHPDVLTYCVLLLGLLVLILLASLYVLRCKLKDPTNELALPLRAPTPLTKPVLTASELNAGLEYCAASAARFAPDVVVGINRGGAIVGGWIARHIHLPCVQVIAAAGSGNGELLFMFPEHLMDSKTGLPVDPKQPVTILVVDDSHWSGRNMIEVTRWIGNRYPNARIRTLVLVYLDAKRPGGASHTVDDCAYVTRDGRCRMPWDSSVAPERPQQAA